jgi:hypothetical protein
VPAGRSGPGVVGVRWECGVNRQKKKSCEGEGKGAAVVLGPFKAVWWHGAVGGGGCACHAIEEERGGQGQQWRDRGERGRAV